MRFIAYVTDITIIEDQTHGYRESYKDGLFKQEPHPCAIVKGTQKI